jgi:DNA repair protein RadC
LERDLDVGDVTAGSADYSAASAHLPKLGCIVSETAQLLAYLCRLDAGRQDEFVHVFFFDRVRRLTWSETLASGLSGTARLEFRQLICMALRVDAAGLILAHNHPSGAASPSARDVSSTLELQRICRRIGIEVIDHLIVTSGNCFSFRGERLLRGES